MKKLKISLIALTTLLLMQNCKEPEPEDNLDESATNTCEVVPTYTSQVKAVIDLKCATNGCHGAHDYPRKFDTYSGLSADLQSGEIYRAIFVTKSMPRTGELKIGESSLLECWLENEYPE